MFTNVVVAIASADRAADAVAAARAVAPDATLALLNVFPYWDSPLEPDHQAYHDQLRAEAVSMLDAVRVAEGLDGAKFYAVADTSPGRAIKAFAAKSAAGLVVVGSAHHGRLGRAVLGDTGHAVMHGAPCPVLVAPAGFHSRCARPGSIGVAFNGSPEAERALACAVGLAQALGSHLELAEVLEAGPIPDSWGYERADYLQALAAPVKKHLDEVAGGLPVSARGTLLQGSVHIALRDFSRRVDLMVCGSRGWGPAAHLAFGSTAQRLAHEAAGLVMVVPRGAAIEPGTDAEPVDNPAAAQH